MSTPDDLVLALTFSVIVEEFEHGIKVWKYKINKSTFGYYVATESMKKDLVEDCACPFPNVDKKRRIRSFADARLFAQDRVRWTDKMIEMKEGPVNSVQVLNGVIKIE